MTGTCWVYDLDTKTRTWTFNERLSHGEGCWQPIETAPNDERDLLIAYEDWVTIGFRENGRWYNDVGAPLGEPDHWMPLPKPPASRCDNE